MAGLPGVNTIAVGRIFGVNRGELTSLNTNNRYNIIDSVGKEGYQFMNYANGDIITLQQIVIARPRINPTIDRYTKSDQQPKDVHSLMSRRFYGADSG